MARGRNTAATAEHQIRIIGGQWRGRKLAVPSLEGLRPTSNRIRETLFNWLQYEVRGAHCLDCFAGSGALGFEAASRGAERVVLVESARVAVKNLQDQLVNFPDAAIEIAPVDIREYLSNCSKTFDLVFIDPPYAQASLRDEVIAALIHNNCLHNQARIFIEWPSTEDFSLIDDRLIWLKQKRAGQVCYGLALWQVNR